MFLWSPSEKILSIYLCISNVFLGFLGNYIANSPLLGPPSEFQGRGAPELGLPHCIRFSINQFVIIKVKVLHQESPVQRWQKSAIKYLVMRNSTPFLWLLILKNSRSVVDNFFQFLMWELNRNNLKIFSFSGSTTRCPTRCLKTLSKSYFVI